MERRWIFRLSLVLLTIAMLSGCEEFLDQIDTINITMEEQIVDEDVIGDPTHIQLIETAQLGGPGGVAKLVETGWVEIEMSISDYILLLNILDEGGAAFTGTVTNHAANAVTFGIYLSETSGLGDPLTGATEIATTVIAAGAVLDLSDLSGFVSVMQDFFTSHPGIESVYVYFTGTADPDLDVTLNDVAFTMPPAVRVTERINYDDYADYEDLYQEVLSGDVDGIIVNNGAADVSMIIYVSVMGPGFVPTILPPAEDVILDMIVGPGSTVDVSGVVNEAVLLNRIETLFTDHADLWVTAILLSDAAIRASLQDIRVQATVSVTT